MALLIQRIARGLIPPRFSADRPPARNTRPDRIVLGVRPGSRASDQPPVRIFLGTERGQFRAERAFLWSIEKHRDPGRIYEIHLMRDLKGFRRGFWLTGFTNYRFAIPEFAGFEGRAIYNDADQVYLTDPARLFDQAMGSAGFLSINDRDTSVMLIDCKRMAEAWNAHDVRRLKRQKLEARAREARLWGELDAGWNARDSEYQPGQSHLVHFTTLHTQPWRPFPDQFVYFPNPTGRLWPDLEDEASQAGFMPVSAARPSRDWAHFRLKLSARSDGPQLQSLLAVRSQFEPQAQLSVGCWLSSVPDADLPWVLDHLFRATAQLDLDIREPRLNQHGRFRRSRYFWLQQLALASAAHPEVSWTLRHRRSPFSRPQTFHGGPAGTGELLVLLHRKPGHNQQARAIGAELARQSGRRLVEHRLEISEAGWLLRRALGLQPRINGLEKAGVVIAGGWLPCRVARGLLDKRPDLRVVLSGRKAGPTLEHGGMLVQCRHFGLPEGPGRLLTRLPLNAGLSEDSADSGRWSEWLDSKSRVALLVGGSSRSHHLDARQARAMAAQVSAWAAEHDARLLVVTSRRSRPVLDALADGLSEQDLLYRFDQDPRGDNPYALALAHADRLVVTGESESMLADAASHGRGFLIWPLARRAGGPWARLARAVASKGSRPRFNRRGSIRPQQGLTYLCARLVERNRILPPRDTEALLDTLYRDGVAAPFGQPRPASFRPASELIDSVALIRRRLAIEPAADQSDAESSRTTRTAES